MKITKMLFKRLIIIFIILLLLFVLFYAFFKKEKEPVSYKEISASQNSFEIEINGEKYYLEFVPKETIYPAYGYCNGDKAIVREDLPSRVKNFVQAHELYHCQDKNWSGGWVGREIRANLIPGLKDPIGLMATAWKSITSIDRIIFYLNRIKEGY